MGPSTAFNRHGLCVPVNTTGLAAYCLWVRRVVGRWSVRRVLPRAARRALDAEARRLHNYTEIFPYAHRAHAARKAELHAMLDAALREALAAQGYAEPSVHGVYRACFPNEVQVAAYERRSRRRVAEAREARVDDYVRRVHRQGMGEAAAVASASMRPRG